MEIWILWVVGHSTRIRYKSLNKPMQRFPLGRRRRSRGWVTSLEFYQLVVQWPVTSHDCTKNGRPADRNGGYKDVESTKKMNKPNLETAGPPVSRHLQAPPFYNFINTWILNNSLFLVSDFIKMQSSLLQTARYVSRPFGRTALSPFLGSFQVLKI